MRYHDRFISASEIGTWCYCKRAWHIQQLGYPSTLTAGRMAGTRHHRTHFQNLRGARRQHAVARATMLICLVLIVWLEIAGSWSARW
jgi:hypothetical protein